MASLKINNQRAFTLIEVIVVAGLMSVMSLGLTRIMVNQNRSVKTTESKLEIINAVDSIRALLADRETCWSTFRIQRTGGSITGVFNPNQIGAGLVTEIKNKNDVRFFPVKTKLGSTTSYIENYVLKSQTSVAPGTAGISEFLISFYRGKAVFGAKKLTRKINLFVETDSSGNMVDCSSKASNFEASANYLCTTFGGTFDAQGRNLRGDCAGIAINGDSSFEDSLEIKGKITVEDEVTVNAPSFFNGKSTMNGDVELKDGFGLTMLSDRRLKYAIKDLDSALSKVEGMRPVAFRWKKNDRQDIGFIAQELGLLYPNLVSQTPNSHLAVKYSQLAVVAIKGLQELAQKVRQLEKRLHKQAQNQEVVP